MEIMEYLNSKAGQHIRIPPVPMMTYKGIEAIKDYLRSEFIFLSNIASIEEMSRYYKYAEHVDEAIKSTGDELSTKRGKWTTRFRKELKSLGIAINDRQLGRIGDIVMMTTDMDGPWFVNFADKFDWHDGEFEDGGSCFWSCRTNNRDMMEFYHGLAIRTYRSDAFEEGSGRAWICSPNLTFMEDNTAVLFNAYGKRLDKFSHIIKRLCQIDGITVFERDEVDIRCDGGDFWINNGQGIAMSFVDKIPGMVDLNYQNVHGKYHWRENFGDGDAVCHQCGKEIVPTEQNRIIEDNAITRHLNNFTLLCVDCINNLDEYKYCGRCHSVHPNDHFIKDKLGHEFCIYAATWWFVCSRCGRVHNYDYEAFSEYMKFDFDSLRYRCRDCTIDYTGRPYQYMYGPTCYDCNEYINRRASYKVFSDYLDDILLERAEKFERKEK